MKRLLLSALFSLLCGPAFATCSGVPTTFVNGTVADATQVNGNFTALTGCINGIDGGQITTGTIPSGRLTGGYSGISGLGTVTSGDVSALARPYSVANYYVATAGNGGNDANDGLSPTVSGGHGPWLTLQHAFNIIGLSDPFKSTPTLNIGAGTFTAGMSCVIPFVMIISGAGSGSTTITDNTLAGTFIAERACVFEVTAMTIASTHGSALFPSQGGVILTGPDIIFGGTTAGTLHAETAGLIQVLNNFTLTAGAPAAFQAVQGGNILFSETAITVTITGTPNYTQGFAQASQGGLVYVPNAFITFSGAATGVRALISTLGKVETNGGSGTYLPGNSPIALSTGGQYGPPPQPTTGVTSGLGASGTVAMVAGSTDHSIFLELLPSGAGIAANGSAVINFATTVNNPSCSAPGTNPGSGAWANTAATALNGINSSTVSVEWNNGAPLTGGSTYFLGLICGNS